MGHRRGCRKPRGPGAGSPQDGRDGVRAAGSEGSLSPPHAPGPVLKWPAGLAVPTDKTSPFWSHTTPRSPTSTAPRFHKRRLCPTQASGRVRVHTQVARWRQHAREPRADPASPLHGDRPRPRFSPGATGRGPRVQLCPQHLIGSKALLPHGEIYF